MEALFVAHSDDASVVLAGKFVMEWASASLAVASAVLSATLNVLLTKIDDVRTGVGLSSLFAVVNRFWSIAPEYAALAYGVAMGVDGACGVQSDDDGAVADVDSLARGRNRYGCR